MVINNAVYSNGKIIGYKCITCGKIVQSMYGNDCNMCVLLKKLTKSE